MRGPGTKSRDSLDAEADVDVPPRARAEDPYEAPTELRPTLLDQGLLRQMAQRLASFRNSGVVKAG
jgi:hypothetical protein